MAGRTGRSGLMWNWLVGLVPFVLALLFVFFFFGAQPTA
jgi:hypothetical protein